MSVAPKAGENIHFYDANLAGFRKAVFGKDGRQKICDCLAYLGLPQTGPRVIVVELKGANVEDAYKQVASVGLALCSLKTRPTQCRVIGFILAKRAAPANRRKSLDRDFFHIYVKSFNGTGNFDLRKQPGLFT